MRSLITSTRVGSSHPAAADIRVIGLDLPFTQTKGVVARHLTSCWKTNTGTTTEKTQ